MWRNKAYELGGTPLPWKPEELLRKEYERGYADAMNWPERPWVGLTDEEITELHHEIKVRLMGTYKTEDIYRTIEAKLKEKNT